MFSPSLLIQVIVILFCLAAHFTFSEDYKFRTLQWNWSSNHADMIMCTSSSSSSSSLATGPGQNDYKLSTICHNFCSDSSPAYLTDLLTVYTPSRWHCSSADTWTLRIPHIKPKFFGQHFFSYSAPKPWNALPSDICQIQSSHAFKTKLETHLYKQYYNNWFQNLSSFFPNPPPPYLSQSCLCTPTFMCECWCVCVWCVRGVYYVYILFF